MNFKIKTFNLNMAKKAVALFMSVLMLISIVPSNIFTSYAAIELEKQCIAVDIDGKKVYVYGADLVNTFHFKEDNSAGLDIVDFSGYIDGLSESSRVKFYVNGSVVKSGTPEVDYSHLEKVTVSINNWASKQSGWVAIQIGDKQKVPSSEPKSVKVDKTAPKMPTIKFSPDGWTNNCLEAICTGEDNAGGSGVVAYVWDTVDEPKDDESFTPDGDFAFYDNDAENAPKRRVRTIDRNGNVSPIYEFEVKNKFDFDSPVINHVEFKPSSSWSNNIIATVVASDALSGVAEYKMDGDPDDESGWQTSNSFKIKDQLVHKFYAKDKAGNYTSYTTVSSVKYDDIKPVVDSVEIKTEDGEIVGEDDYTNNSNYTFIVNAHDVNNEDGESSGIAFYSKDTLNWQPSNQFSLPGATEYNFFVEDNAANTSEPMTVTLKEDVDKPVISSVDSINGTDPTNKPVQVRVNATDATSGISAYKMDDGEWQTSNEFEISDCKEHTFYVSDNTKPANVSEVTYTAEHFCDKEPEISSVTLSNSDETGVQSWTNNEITATVDASSVYSSASKEFKIVGYKMDGDPADDEGWKTTNNFVINDCKAHSFYVKDEAGCVSAAYEISEFKYDSLAPVLKNVEFKQVNSGTFAKVLNKLSFGKFFNEKLKVTVKLEETSDENNALSGIDTSKLKFDFKSADNSIAFTDGQFDVTEKDGVTEVTLELSNKAVLENFYGSLYISVADNAGNALNNVQVTSLNSNLFDVTDSDFNFMLENDAPVISSNGTDALTAENAAGGATLFKDSFDIGFCVNDKTDSEYSGLSSVKVEVNGNEVFNEDYTSQDTKVDEKSIKCTFDKSSVTVADDCKLNFVITACDNSGNASRNEFTLYYDDIKPEFECNSDMDGWTNLNAKVTLVATDNYALDEKAYKLDDGEYSSNNIYNISDSKTHTFYVRDKAGNVTSKTYKLKFDVVPPTIKDIKISTNDFTNQPVTVTVDAEDLPLNPENGDEAISGVAKYKMDGDSSEESGWHKEPTFEVSDDVEHTFYVKDNAGNIASAKKAVDNYDDKKPENLSFEVTDPEGKKLDSTSYVNDTELYSFALSATDNKGKIKQYGIKTSASSEIEWLGADDDGTPIAVVSKKATEIYSIFAMDPAGNVSDEYKVELNIDTSAPTFDIKYKSILTNKPVTVTVKKAEDKESGLYVDKEGNTTAYKMDSGDWQTQNTFVVADNNEHTIYVRNGAHITASKNFVVSNYIYKQRLKAPEVSEETTEWTNEKVTVKVKGSQYTNILGVSAKIVKYSIDGGPWVEGENSDVFEVHDCKVHKYKVMDEAGNVSAETLFAAKHFDAQAPQLDTVKFEQKNDNQFAKLLNKLTFGNFFNKHLEITVVAKDPTNPVDREEDGVISEASLIKDIQFVFDNGNSEEKIVFDNDINSDNPKIKDVSADNENGTTTFKIKVSDTLKLDNFKGKAYLTLVDNAGNKNENNSINCVNSNVGEIKDTDYNFTLENDAPTFYASNGELLTQENAVSSVNGVVKNAYSLDFKVSDVAFNESGDEKDYSGLACVKVAVNGKEILKKDLNDTDCVPGESFTIPVVGFVNDGKNKPAESSYTVNGIKMFSEQADKDFWNNGELNFELYAVDNAGNESVPISLTYTFDQTSPVITKFEIADKEASNKDYVMADNYGFFFREDATVKIHASDVKNTDVNEAYASGVDSITVLRINSDGNVEQNVFTSSASEEESTLDFDGDEAIATLQINKGFKGQIYAFATDKVGNKPSTAEFYADKDISVTFGSETYVHPDGTIIEDQEEHIANSSIQITQSNKPVATQCNKKDYEDAALEKDKVISYNPSEDVPLYDKNATFVSKISDPKAGIASIKYSVIENGKESSKTVKVNTVAASSKDSKKDVVTPTISNEDSDFTVNTGNTDQSGNSKEEWSVKSKISSTDLNIATGIESVITVDANYNDIVFKIELTDNAGNKSYNYTIFGIDKTAPQISVQYESAAKPVTGNYYSKTRTAYISVKERNITSNDVQLLIQKCLNSGRNFASSDQSEFYRGFDIEHNLYSNGSGNYDDREYRIKVVFSDDGNYLIRRLACTDLAKNASGEVTYGKLQSSSNNDAVTADNSTMFTIDKTKPEIKVSLDINDQVKNKRYFNRTRTATITVNEHNFNASDAQAFINNITASLNGRGITKPSVSYFRQNGADSWVATVTFAADGDYTLGFKAVDKAGNEYEITKATTSAFSGAAASDFTIDKTAPTISITDALSNKHAYVNVPTIVITEKDNNASTIISSVDGTYFNKDSASLKQMSLPAQNSGELIADHRLENQVTYTAVENDGVYTIKARCVDMAGNRSEEKVITFTKNENGSVYIPSADLLALNKVGYSNSESLSSDLYVDEYSSVPIEDAEYYMNINGKRQDNSKMLSREQMNDEESGKGGWYHYRYLINRNEIHAEGKYSLYVKSNVNVDNKVIQNNSEDNSELNRVDVNFVIDNTNPYVKIEGLDRHTYINTAKVPVTFYVSDTNLSYIKVWIYNGNDKVDEDTVPTYFWSAQADSENGILAWDEENGLIKVAFDLFASARSTNVKFEIVDKAGNRCSKESDFNLDQLFTSGAEESQRMGFFDLEDGSIVLKAISINEKLSVSAVASIIKDNIKLAVAIIVAVIIIIAAAIILPIIARRRKKLDDEDSKLLD